MKKSTRVFMTVGILVIAGALLCFLSFLFRIVDDYSVAYQQTTISNFKICSVDNPVENTDASCGNSFPVGIPELYACGYVNADYLKPGKFVDLGIYLNDHKAGLPLYQNQDKFSTGNFCREIIISNNSPPGLYYVTAYFGRKLVASAQFVLK